VRHALRRSGKGARRVEGLSSIFLIDDREEGPRATFQAVLETGSPAELAALKAAGARLRGHVGRAVSFYGSLDRAADFARVSGVRSLDLARRMTPELDISRPETGAPFVRDPNGLPVTGAGVLVAGIDTGHDLKHLDFRRTDLTTRFRSVLNMVPTCRGPRLPAHPDACYFDESRINVYLKGRAGVDYPDPPASLGHGSHTLGIAAGNGLATGHAEPPETYVGMAPGADLIGVKIFDARGTQVGDLTEAVQFLIEEQSRLGNPPLVVNMSLGHHFGAHDGSHPDEIAIDEAVEAGMASGIVRVFVKSAGNSGADGVFIADTAVVGTPVDHTFTVPRLDANRRVCGALRGRGNDVFVALLWYEGTDDITLRVTAPDGISFFENLTGNAAGPIELDTSSGTIFVDCPEEPFPGNLSRECAFGVDDAGGIPPAPGVWTVTVTGNDLPAGGDYDAWIGAAQKGRCFWGWDDPDAGSSLTIPGTARLGITVGAYVTRKSWVNVDGFLVADKDPSLLIGDIAPFSSTGPTRDGRPKPDIAAPGAWVVSTKARSVPAPPGSNNRLLTVFDGRHIANQGTSMSAPHVAGAAALLLEIDPTLDPLTLRQILMDAAVADAFTGAVPNLIWGAGKLDVEAAAALVRTRKRTPAPPEP